VGLFKRETPHLSWITHHESLVEYPAPHAYRYRRHIIDGQALQELTERLQRYTIVPVI
jgi:hypothetical protein